MIRTRALPFSLVLALAIAGVSPAHAQGKTGAGGVGPGVGVAAMLTAPGRPATMPAAGPLAGALDLVYEGGPWHADVLFSATNVGDTRFLVGARGFFHLHSGAGADFSVGGGLGYFHQNRPVVSDLDVLHLEAGFMLRAFVSQNIALSTFGGLGVLANDGGGDWLLGGEFVGSLGFTYFFF